ncbi:hypothetical protein CSUI_008976 [Cystoisospora suis]|uniref:Uncharacterized protein n=1 Tax=Cystoisospora suis TaxID=483139 RepID=A0A2C6KLA6_9APIC|nr:hypothetical protein CSUI_008976 [Cystoisospora suis]
MPFVDLLSLVGGVPRHLEFRPECLRWSLWLSPCLVMRPGDYCLVLRHI